jgi:hypothetical protein
LYYLRQVSNFFCANRNGQQRVGVRAFGPELAGERLNEAVGGRLAWPREVKGDVVGIGPEAEVTGDELTAIVHPGRLGVASHPEDAFQGLNDIFAPIGEACVGGRTVPEDSSYELV